MFGGWVGGLGSEEAVRRVLVKGYIEAWAAFAYDAFEALYEIACLAFFLLNVADPVVLAGAYYYLLRVCGHCVEEWRLAIDVEVWGHGGAFAGW